MHSTIRYAATSLLILYAVSAHAQGYSSTFFDARLHYKVEAQWPTPPARCIGADTAQRRTCGAR